MFVFKPLLLQGGVHYIALKSPAELKGIIVLSYWFYKHCLFCFLSLQSIWNGCSTNGQNLEVTRVKDSLSVTVKNIFQRFSWMQFSHSTLKISSLYLVLMYDKIKLLYSAKKCMCFIYKMII